MQLGWALGIIFAGLLYILLGGSALLKSQLEVLAWKLVLVGTAVGLAHLIRKQLFSYVDLSEMLAEKSVAGSVVFLGVAVVYGSIIYAVCSGL
jgi:uncharacterized membrane protein